MNFRLAAYLLMASACAAFVLAYFVFDVGWGRTSVAVVPFLTGAVSLYFNARQHSSKTRRQGQ
jgi:hypothetical protein